MTKVPLTIKKGENMNNTYSMVPTITRTKRKKSDKDQAKLDNISKKINVIAKKWNQNIDKMKPLKDKLEPFEKAQWKLDIQKANLELARSKILEKYEYEVKNPELKNIPIYDAQ